jgi:hypothetical protein
MGTASVTDYPNSNFSHTRTKLKCVAQRWASKDFLEYEYEYFEYCAHLWRGVYVSLVIVSCILSRECVAVRIIVFYLSTIHSPFCFMHTATYKTTPLNVPNLFILVYLFFYIISQLVVQGCASTNTECTLSWTLSCAIMNCVTSTVIKSCGHAKTLEFVPCTGNHVF